MNFYKKIQQFIFLSLSLTALTTNANEQTLISQNDLLYPRVIKLSHNADASKNGAIIATGTAFDGGPHGGVFISTDNGESFSPQGRIDDPDFNKGICCGGLYELPVAIGNLPAGTLLWSPSVGQEKAGEPMQLKIYQSSDQGAHWSYLSNCITASKPKSNGGLWESEFTIAADGRLVCFYSDETQIGHSQVLRYTATSDGINWSAPVDVVSSNTQGDRPGMANVVKLPDGRYVMSYEICGPLNCSAHMRLSPDGLDWGNPQHLGSAVLTKDGLTFWGTPTLIWAPLTGNPKGQLILQGHTLVKNTADQPGNGKTLFINASGDPAGDWVAFDSPTYIPLPAGTGGNYCQNYSNPMLVLGAGKLLELASDFVNGQSCKTWFRASHLGGVRASLGNVAVKKGETGKADINLNVSNGFSGAYKVAVDIPGIPATVTLSDTTVTLDPSATTSLQLSITPTSVAALGPRDMTIMHAGIFGAPLLMGLFGLRRKKPLVFWLAVLALPLLVTACGGGGGGSSGSTSSSAPTVSTNYNGTLTVTSLADESVTTSVAFKVTITK